MSSSIIEWLDAFDDLRHEAERYIDTGDAVVVLVRFSCTAKASGMAIDREVADVVTLRDGRIVRFHQYWDRAEALEAVGLSE